MGLFERIDQNELENKLITCDNFAISNLVIGKHINPYLDQVLLIEEGLNLQGDLVLSHKSPQQKYYIGGKVDYNDLIDFENGVSNGLIENFSSGLSDALIKNSVVRETKEEVGIDKCLLDAIVDTHFYSSIEVEAYSLSKNEIVWKKNFLVKYFLSTLPLNKVPKLRSLTPDRSELKSRRSVSIIKHINKIDKFFRNSKTDEELIKILGEYSRPGLIEHLFVLSKFRNQEKNRVQPLESDGGYISQLIVNDGFYDESMGHNLRVARKEIIDFGRSLKTTQLPREK